MAILATVIVKPANLGPCFCYRAKPIANSNPLDYGYKLLQASGEFPEATWNI